MTDTQRRHAELILLLGLLGGLWAASLHGAWWAAVPLGCACYVAGRLAAHRERDEYEDDDGGPEPEEDEVEYARGWLSPPATVEDLERN